MTFRLIAALLLLSLPTAARADLSTDVHTVLKDKSLARAAVAVEVVRLGQTADADAVLFQHNANQPLIPASNLKLVTTSAAVDLLGPDFKFRTLLLKRGNDLVLIGDGDPTLGDAEMLRKVGWDVTTLFKNWAEGLKKANLTQFDRLVVDDAVFDMQFAHPNWPADQLHKRYVAQVGGLNLNANCVDFYLRVTSPGEVVRYAMAPDTRYVTVANGCVTGGENAVWLSRQLNTNQIVLRGRTPASNELPLSVTIHDPALFTGSVLWETLTAAGVAIKAPAVVRDRTLRATLLKDGLDASWAVLAVHETPLSTVLARANKDSMNVYADALCKRVGALSGESGSWKNGNAAIGEHLKKIGVPAGEFKLDDGCGLSKENTISASALGRVLRHHFHDKTTKEAYFASLSVAGVDGTLEGRFTNSDLRGRVFGKSGFVNGVRTLSGYVRAKDGAWYGFSILMNQVNDTGAAKTLQEQIVRAIDANSRTVATVGE